MYFYDCMHIYLIHKFSKSRLIASYGFIFSFSGSNVINVNVGNIKYVHCLMEEEMIVGKLNILAPTATLWK